MLLHNIRNQLYSDSASQKTESSYTI